MNPHDPDPLVVLEDEPTIEQKRAIRDYWLPGILAGFGLGFLFALLVTGQLHAAAPRDGQFPLSDADHLGAPPLPGVLSIVTPEVRESAVGTHRYPDPVSGGGVPSPVTVFEDTSPGITGTASYCAPTPRYCHGWGGSAKLGAVPSFRWGDRQYAVRVCRQDQRSRCTTVTVVSFCACSTRVIDLSPSAFARLAPLSRGLVRVTVSAVGAAPTPPATDVQP